MRLLGPLPKDVLEVVSELTGLDQNEVCCDRGKAAKARFIVGWVAHRFGATWKELGDLLNVHPSTVQNWAIGVENDRELLLAALAVVDVLNARHAPLPEPLFFDVVTNGN